MIEQKRKCIPLGERWDMQEAMLLDSALPKATKPGNGFKPNTEKKIQKTDSSISPKTSELLSKLKEKR